MLRTHTLVIKTKHNKHNKHTICPQHNTIIYLPYLNVHMTYIHVIISNTIKRYYSNIRLRTIHWYLYHDPFKKKQSFYQYN